MVGVGIKEEREATCAFIAELVVSCAILASQMLFCQCNIKELSIWLAESGSNRT